MSREKNRRVLIVDDNASIHDDFRKIIGDHGEKNAAIDRLAASIFDEPAAPGPRLAGYELDSAFQGQEAVARVEQSVSEGRPYSMAFVDVPNAARLGRN